ncbi:MAG: hypothetical protein HKO70_05780 [Acidimicrobiia bacterium]|nr:hypothetical protein [Acidimicrobiia bacterium]
MRYSARTTGGPAVTGQWYWSEAAFGGSLVAGRRLPVAGQKEHEEDEWV